MSIFEVTALLFSAIFKVDGHPSLTVCNCLFSVCIYFPYLKDISGNKSCKIYEYIYDVLSLNQISYAWLQVFKQLSRDVAFLPYCCCILSSVFYSVLIPEI